MNQSFDTQLQVLKRALVEVVMPALDGASSHVIEQLRLSISLIDFMRSRLPLARQFYAAELQGFIALGRSAAGIVHDHDRASAEVIEALLSSSEAALADPEAGSGKLVETTRKLRSAIAQLSEKAAGYEYEKALDALIVKQSAEAHVQARIWCEPFGFELTPDTLSTPDWMNKRALSKQMHLDQKVTINDSVSEPGMAELQDSNLRIIEVNVPKSS